MHQWYVGLVHLRQLGCQPAGGGHSLAQTDRRQSGTGWWEGAVRHLASLLVLVQAGGMLAGVCNFVIGR